MNEIPCEVGVLAGSVTNPEENKKSTSVRAIWDTGATASVITSKVAKALSLVPVGMTEVHTAGGVRMCNVYIVDLMLPNEVFIPNVQVTEADMTANDVLIGMDIITLGDFALTNFGGKTRFTFSIPSTRVIDFVQEGQAMKRKAKIGNHGGKKTTSKRKQEKKNKKAGRKRR